MGIAERSHVASQAGRQVPGSTSVGRWARCQPITCMCPRVLGGVHQPVCVHARSLGGPGVSVCMQASRGSVCASRCVDVQECAVSVGVSVWPTGARPWVYTSVHYHVGGLQCGDVSLCS